MKAEVPGWTGVNGGGMNNEHRGEGVCGHGEQ